VIVKSLTLLAIGYFMLHLVSWLSTPVLVPRM